MNVYTFNFDGLALGGKMVIVAKNEEEATTLAKEQVSGGAVKVTALKSLRLTSTEKMQKPMVVHFDNGDY